MKVNVESRVPHLTLFECMRKMCFPLHFLLMENDMESTVGGATPWHGPLLCWSVTKLQLSGWRGKGEAFEAITDNQNSTEPREGEEIESNGGGGEGTSCSWTVWWKPEFFFYQRKKEACFCWS